MLVAAPAFAPALATPAPSAPQRVVSMNLCTDQLAMMLAAPGQLISVSDLAQDKRMSPMAQEAAGYPINRGRAEEIYLMNPDLVIAGEYASAPTVAMLRRLGIRVEVLSPAEDIDAIRDQITQVGDLLGQPEKARQILADFDTGLARVTSKTGRGRAALYYANGFTSGRDTLAGIIVTTAGYDNIANDYGVTETRALPLELLVMSDPDRLITGAKWPGQSRSEAILDHPVLAEITPNIIEATDANWVCGTPFILHAIRSLQ
ncbi:ABC transporter substrate-binding protein [Paracoccus sp. 11-3]|uniref:ABC transporter substrate-binding protein n=2 Tax=Paracoccus amoyensis TaxID=2760093 RepID=A0A926GEH5_9RHOB|nr:ABC transporter substrate-binding protein [Paracoccus amoyensis]